MADELNPPPYQGAAYANTKGPAQYPGDQSNMGQPYMGQPNMGQPYMGQPNMGQGYMGQQNMGQPYMGQQNMGQPYMPQPQMAPPYGGSQPIVVNVSQATTQSQQQQQQQTVIVQRSGVNHGLCCLICVCTAGLSLPCWIIAALAD